MSNKNVCFLQTFSVSEIIVRNIEGYPGIKVGGHNVSNLRYAGDAVLITENQEDLQILDIFGEESCKKGLELNSKKKKSKKASNGR